MRRRPVFQIPLVIGLFAGAFLAATSARAEPPASSAAPSRVSGPSPAADVMLAGIAWRVMTEDQKVLVELVARDAAAEAGERWDAASDRRRAALRGYAMRLLGVDDRALRRGVV